MSNSRSPVTAIAYLPLGPFCPLGPGKPCAPNLPGVPSCPFNPKRAPRSLIK